MLFSLLLGLCAQWSSSAYAAFELQDCQPLLSDRLSPEVLLMRPNGSLILKDLRQTLGRHRLERFFKLLGSQDSSVQERLLSKIFAWHPFKIEVLAREVLSAEKEEIPSLLETASHDADEFWDGIWARAKTTDPWDLRNKPARARRLEESANQIKTGKNLIALMDDVREVSVSQFDQPEMKLRFRAYIGRLREPIVLYRKEVHSFLPRAIYGEPITYESVTGEQIAKHVGGATRSLGFPLLYAPSSERALRVSINMADFKYLYKFRVEAGAELIVLPPPFSEKEVLVRCRGCLKVLGVEEIK